MVKVHCTGSHTRFQSREQASVLADTEDNESNTLSEKSSSAVMSKVAFLESFSFFNVEAKQTLCVEVLKQCGRNYKSFAWVDVPLALVADPKQECRLEGLFSLEGMPSSHEFLNVSMEMEFDWVPLDGKPIPNMDYFLHDLGTLHVRLCNARGLPKTDVIGSIDPFVEFTIGSRKKHVSSVQKRNRSPEWMEQFKFQRVDRSSSLLVTVQDYSSMTSGYKKSKFVGDVCIPISALLRSSNRISGTWKLQSAKKGSICMDLAWEPYASEMQAFLQTPEYEDTAPASAALWPHPPVEDMVPPFAFSNQRWDVEARLISAHIAELRGEDATHLHCYLHLKDTEHKSQARPLQDLLWDETFRWQAVQCGDTLDVTVMAGSEPLGICSIELHELEVDEIKEFECVIDDIGTLKLAMRVEHAAADGGVGSFSNIGACLNITLKELRNLVAKDVSGYSDPYCRLKIGDQTFKSTTKFNTLDAVYGEHFQFLDVKPDQILEVWVYDYDRVGSDEHLGHVEIPLLGIKSAPGSTVEDSWDLKDTASGSVQLMVRWLDNPRSTSVSPVKAASQQPEGQPQTGTLTLTVHAAKELPKAMFGSVDAYIKATMQKNDQVYRSLVVHGRDPVWDDATFSFQNVLSSDVLTVRVADKQTIGKSVIGFVTIAVEEVLANDCAINHRPWPIISQTCGPAGLLDLSLHYAT